MGGSETRTEPPWGRAKLQVPWCHKDNRTRTTSGIPDEVSKDASPNWQCGASKPVVPVYMKNKDGNDRNDVIAPMAVQGAMTNMGMGTRCNNRVTKAFNETLLLIV